MYSVLKTNLYSWRVTEKSITSSWYNNNWNIFKRWTFEPPAVQLDIENCLILNYIETDELRKFVLKKVSLSFLIIKMTIVWLFVFWLRGKKIFANIKKTRKKKVMKQKMRIHCLENLNKSLSFFCMNKECISYSW